MAKQIISSTKARKALQDGLDKVANAVRITMGPRGRNVVLDKGYGTPTITNDGVSIAKEIVLPNKFENMGAEIIKEVASKTNDIAGDGTTTAVVLTQALVNDGMAHTLKGANPMGVRRGIEAALADALAELKSMAKPIKSDKEIEQVATISAESEEIGKTIATTIKKVGKDGVVTVEESQAFGIESEVVEGLEFDKGYASLYMITNGERMEAEYKDVPILITDKKISVIQTILPLLEKLAQSGRKDLVIIAEDVEGEALTTLVVNKLRGGFNALVVKAPGYGDRKKDLLEDLAILTGGTLVTDATGMKLEDATPAVFGRASKIIATKDKTIIVGGKGKKADITARITAIKKQLAGAGKYDKEKLEERIAKLSGGVAVLKVGAATETEMKYLKLKIEDAVNATKAAIEEGIVSGGGTALVLVAKKLREKLAKLAPKKTDNAKQDKEFRDGYKVLVDSLTAPIKQIIANTGRADAKKIILSIEQNPASGYDASKDEMTANMIEAGIIDPVKVTRSGLQHAVSAAAILLTTEVAITDIPEPKAPAPQGGDMGY
jgi:chaperonin GroEL